MGADVDVLVANRNTWPELWHGIVAPLMWSWGRELRLVICDDCSRDGEIDEIRKWLPASAELLVNSERRGVAATFNRLLDVATAPYRLLINSDCVCRHVGEIEKLCVAVESTRGLALVGTAEGPRFLDEYGEPYTLAPTSEYVGAIVQGYVSGCVLMMPGSGKIAELRFEDAWSWAYYEDTDMSYTARSRGWRAVWVPTEIEHMGQVALSREAAALAAGGFEDGPERWRSRARNGFMRRWGYALRRRRATYCEAVRDVWEVDEVLRAEGPKWLDG